MKKKKCLLYILFLVLFLTPCSVSFANSASVPVSQPQTSGQVNGQTNADTESSVIGKDAVKEVNRLASKITPILRTVGTLIMVLGVWKFASSTQSDQVEGLSKGTAELITGAVISNITTLLL